MLLSINLPTGVDINLLLTLFPLLAGGNRVYDPKRKERV